MSEKSIAMIVCDGCHDFEEPMVIGQMTGSVNKPRTWSTWTVWPENGPIPKCYDLCPKCTRNVTERLWVEPHRRPEGEKWP